MEVLAGNLKLLFNSALKIVIFNCSILPSQFVLSVARQAYK
jgi:hypothetical protein